ncbi:MAG: hypothetical protein IJJ70_07715 [Treponema sp.]|nr:hypothetical protein [Treponema sp.]MBQ6056428.1 hypothetical protein [Treponema sp.]MBR0487568.1 hypothetical protein [Treponema sp.]
MDEKTFNKLMASAFFIMNRILKCIERGMDADVFDKKSFTAENFNISENRFARLLSMLLEEEYITGIEIIDKGEPEPFEKKNYERYEVLIQDDISITIKGLRFLAENSALANIYRTAKSVKDLIK